MELSDKRGQRTSCCARTQNLFFGISLFGSSIVKIEVRDTTALKGTIMGINVSVLLTRNNNNPNNVSIRKDLAFPARLLIKVVITLSSNILGAGPVFFCEQPTPISEYIQTISAQCSIRISKKKTIVGALVKRNGQTRTAL